MKILPYAGIILASGEGSRLQPVTRGTPKCLAPLVMGRPTLVLTSILLDRVGANPLIAVVRKGWVPKARELLSQAGLEKAEVLENTHPEKGAAYTLYMGLRHIVENIGNYPTLIACCDTLAPLEAFQKLGDQAHRVENGEAVAILAGSRDSTLIDPGEASRIRTDSKGRVLEVGKGVLGSLFDIGLFIASPKSAMEAYERGEWSGEAQLYQLFTRLARASGKVFALDLGSLLWTEVDTPSDLELLETPKGRRLVDIIMEAVVHGR